MSSSIVPDLFKPVTQKKARKSLATALASLEQLLAELQTVEQQQLQQHEEAQERNLILAEMIYMQERLTVILQRQLQWKAAGMPDADSLAQQQLDVESHDRRRQQDLQERQHDLEDRQKQHFGTPHWVLHALETASWEDVQLALSRDADGWISNLHSYYHRLLMLFEAIKRPPGVQAMLLPSSSTPPNIPAMYSVTSSSMEDTPAWDAVVAEMQAQARLLYTALLHGSPALFEAAGRNAITGELCTAPPVHWIGVARRMQFTGQQRLHFKLALQNFERVSKAASERGLQILQQTPSYSFIFACELIAAHRNSSQSSGDNGSSGTDAAMVAGVTAPAPSAGTEPRSSSSSPPASRKPPSSSAAASGKPPRKQRSSSTTARHKQHRRSASTQSTPALAAAAAPAAADACGGAYPLVTSLSAGTPTAQTGSPAAEAAAVQVLSRAGREAAAAAAPQPDDESFSRHPAEDMSHNFACFMRQLVFLNLFLADTLTLEQALVLNIASYPFWPMLAAICEAAVEVDGADAADTQQDGTEVPLQGTQLLMEQRRQFMHQAHSEWWERTS